MDSRICKECDIEKSFDEYYKDSSKPEGYCRAYSAKQNLLDGDRK